MLDITGEGRVREGVSYRIGLFLSSQQGGNWPAGVSGSDSFLTQLLFTFERELIFTQEAFEHMERERQRLSSVTAE